MRTWWVGVVLHALLWSHVGARMLDVPSVEFPTIQAGVDSARFGDTVYVAPGVYTGSGNRDITLRGDGLVLLSRLGSEATILDCQGTLTDPHRAITINSGEASECKIVGFTFRGGYAADAIGPGGPG